MKIVILPGLTLPEVADHDLERIRRAGGGAEVVVSNAEAALTDSASSMPTSCWGS